MNSRKVKIYALINTLDDSVFYIGCTVQRLEARLSNHISRSTDSIKNRLVYNILFKGGKVEILELDECDFADGSKWEQFYIDLFKSFGFVLIQSRISNYNETNPLKRATRCSDKVRLEVHIDMGLEDKIKELAKKEGRTVKNWMESVILKKVK